MRGHLDWAAYVNTGFPQGGGSNGELNIRISIFSHAEPCCCRISARVSDTQVYRMENTKYWYSIERLLLGHADAWSGKSRRYADC